MICKYCGGQLDNNAEYCSFCGKKVLRVPPVFTMARLGTDIAAEAIRSYTEWGFYYNPDAELDPETGKKPEYSYNALDALPDENHLKWASDFIKAEQMEAALLAEAAAKAEAESHDANATETGLTEAEEVLIRAGAELPDRNTVTQADAQPGDMTEEDTDEGEETPEIPDEPVDGAEAGDTSIRGKEAGKKKKKGGSCLVIVIILVLLAAAIAGGAYYLFGANKTYEVDLNALMVEPKVIGYNDYGEMALMPQIDSAKEDEWLRTVEFDVDKENFKQVLDTVTYTPDKTEKLSNGDVVNITISYDQKLAAEKELTVHAKAVQYEVKGLEIGKDLAYDPDAYHAYYDDFILPESDRTMLDREDVAYSTNGSISTTQQAINEIYARHGWIFKDKKYDKLFRSYKWYTPMYKEKDFDNAWLNKYEKANLALLIEYRDELRAAAAKAAEEEAAKAEAEQAEKEKAEEKSENNDQSKDED